MIGRLIQFRDGFPDFDQKWGAFWVSLCIIFVEDPIYGLMC